MAEFLALRDIVKVYGTTVRTTALRGVTFSIGAGEYTALIGRSGSGKSTLLHIIGTLDRPTSGTMRVDGRDIFALDDDDLAAFRSRMIGFVFQFHHLLPEFTALENVLLPFRAAEGKMTGEAERRARRLLERVGVGDRINNKSTDLSGGQQQRVALARALINRPRLILADEPTGNLDTESSGEIKTLLREINRESGTTFLIVTHDRHIAAACDRVIEIDDGGIVRDFRPADLPPDDAWAELAPCECRERIRGDLKPPVRVASRS
jgi:lipoprotein-releasing system ATP-binding protein